MHWPRGSGRGAANSPPDSNGNGNGNAHTHTNGNTDVDTNANANPNPNPEPNPNADLERHARAVTDRHAVCLRHPSAGERGDRPQQQPHSTSEHRGCAGPPERLVAGPRRCRRRRWRTAEQPRPAH